MREEAASWVKVCRVTMTMGVEGLWRILWWAFFLSGIIEAKLPSILDRNKRYQYQHTYPSLKMSASFRNAELMRMGNGYFWKSLGKSTTASHCSPSLTDRSPTNEAVHWSQQSRQNTVTKEADVARARIWLVRPMGARSAGLAGNSVLCSHTLFAGKTGNSNGTENTTS
ncbi:hypothetical protein EYF80_013678 [Liparis tanakae]|uniref:Uncharacterized protein n=1 Tax=Liparis tanakae TaxID=230148 RepID=A0A4Z2IE12_9TELE|nr:hypothetical protein EYF80_013678 [Liparis tanakae]